MNPNLLIRANTENTIIYNNLIYVNSGASMDIRTLNDASKTSFKNNVYYGTTTFGALGSTTTTDYDSTEFNWDPILVNTGGSKANDYKLQSTSSAIGAGILINGSSDIKNYSQNNGGRDYFGNIVLDNANPTIGAHNFDNIAPTASITYDSSGSYKSGDTVVVTATFSENMSDSPVPKIAIAGSGITSVSATNMTKISSKVYTYSYSVPTGDGTGTISLSTGTDISGNVVTSSPTSGASFTIDNTPPTITIVAAEVLDGHNTDNSSITLTFNSSESTSNLIVGDITVSNGSLSSFSGSGTSS